jgi:hypothetical protein
MNYRAKSPDDPNLVSGSSEQAYFSPLSSVLGGYVYNSLLTGRPYFLQLMDDIKIAELFIHSKSSATHRSQQPLTIAATGDAYTLAIRFQELDPSVKVLPSESTPVLQWSTLVSKGQEQWPIALLLPSGALLH